MTDEEQRIRRDEKERGEELCTAGAQAVVEYGPNVDLDDFPGQHDPDTIEMLSHMYAEDWWRRGQDCAVMGWRAEHDRVLKIIDDYIDGILRVPGMHIGNTSDVCQFELALWRLLHLRREVVGIGPDVRDAIVRLAKERDLYEGNLGPCSAIRRRWPTEPLCSPEVLGFYAEWVRRCRENTVTTQENPKP